MSLSSVEFKALIGTTLSLYKYSLIEAWRGFSLNWWALFLPIIYFLALQLVMLVFGFILPSMVVGFIGGFFLALLVANYFAFISAAVEGEKLKLREIKEETLALFSPVIGVMFVIFIVTLLFGSLLKDDRFFLLRIALNLACVIIFNPLPEVTYQGRQNSMAVFGECFEFIKDNVVEWFLPIIVILSPVIAVSYKQTIMLVASSNPLFAPLLVIEAFITGFDFPIQWVATIVVLILAFSFYVMVFRGVLYKRLSTSSRRKRIYQYRFGA